ncbi:hypothetical protein ABH926_003222 [Catenulispora sp. GP43]|uniref:hypothetical protein n=1 Tax=Catenulispora sp. GP43 TaxID=3156263 RepID=UPI0035118451
MFESDRAPWQRLRLQGWEAFVAPIAKGGEAVVQDPELFRVAEAVFDAFANKSSTGGLTKRDLFDACSAICDEQQFNQRFDVFKSLNLLIPAISKKHEDRYLFNPYGAAGILVFDRVVTEGGVDEMMTLLDRTRAAIHRGTATVDQVRGALARARGMLVVAADYLLTLVRTRSLDIMIAERHQHEHPSLLTDVRAVTGQVSLRFPELDRFAYLVVVEVQRYLAARADFVERLLEEGARAENFGVLHHEKYLTAARESTVVQLSEPLARVVVDPPDPMPNPAAIVAQVEQLRPKESETPRPPRPHNPPPDTDPFQSLIDRERKRSDLARALAEVLLAGTDEADLTDELAAAGWPGAARLLLSALHASGSEDDFDVEFRDEFRVESDAAVTYLTPVLLRRRQPWRGAPGE